MVQDSRQRGSPFMSRLYRSDMRPVVITGAFLAILWSLISGISCFRNVPLFDDNHSTNLGVFYIIMGSMYMGVVVIEAFGIFAALSRRVASVRIYAYLSILVALLITAAGIIQTIVHYSFKNTILDVCSNVTTGEHIFFTGFFGPIDGGAVTHSEAEDWCRRHFDHDSFSNIVALLVTSAIAAFFVVFVFAYFRQLYDPTSIVNVSREPIRRDVYPAHYNPPYNPSYNPPYPQYQPPNGPPPNMNMNSDAFVPPYESNDTKPPNYEGGDYKGGYGDQKDDPFWGGHQEGNRPH